MNYSWSTQTELYHNLLTDVFCCYQWNIHKPYLISSDIIWCYIDQWYLFSGEHLHLFPVQPLCPRYGRYVAALFMVCGTVSDDAKKSGGWNAVYVVLSNKKFSFNKIHLQVLSTLSQTFLPASTCYAYITIFYVLYRVITYMGISKTN